MSVLISDGMGGWITSSATSGGYNPTPVVEAQTSAVNKNPKVAPSPFADLVRVFGDAHTVDYATSAYVEVI